MFKYAAVLVGALAVCVSLGAAATAAAAAPEVAAHRQVQQQQQQEPTAASSNIVKKHAKPDKIVYVQEHHSKHEDGGESGLSGLLASGLLGGLMDLVSVPKKLIGAVAGYLLGKLKNLNVKQVLKIALIGAVVTVLGAIASVAVAGLVSLVSAICAALPYIRFVFGGKAEASASESHTDAMSEFVMGAFNKYEGKK